MSTTKVKEKVNGKAIYTRREPEVPFIKKNKDTSFFFMRELYQLNGPMTSVVAGPVVLSCASTIRRATFRPRSFVPVKESETRQRHGLCHDPCNNYE